MLKHMRQTLDDLDRSPVTRHAAPEDAALIADLKQALDDDIASLAEGEQWCLRLGERSLIVERIGENVLLMIDWPRLGRDLHELLDYVIAMNDPVTQLFLFRGQTFLASVRRHPDVDVDDIDRLWAVIHA